MDITEIVLQQNDCPVEVHRLADDDWHQETLPILLNVDASDMNARVSFIDHDSV
jgi:hypothetical protein